MSMLITPENNQPQHVCRSIVASGALAAVVVAGNGSRTSFHHTTEPALLLAAVDLGFQLSCNLRRPPDIGNGDEEMIALVDEVQVLPLLATHARTHATCLLVLVTDGADTFASTVWLNCIRI